LEASILVSLLRGEFRWVGVWESSCWVASQSLSTLWRPDVAPLHETPCRESRSSETRRRVT